LSKAALLLALSLYYQLISTVLENNHPLTTVNAFTFLIHLAHFDIFSFHLLDLRFIDLHLFSFGVILNYISYLYCLITQFLSKLQLCEWVSFIYEIELRPTLLFPNMLKVLSSHNIFIKSDFILKISGMCIDCIFRN